MARTNDHTHRSDTLRNLIRKRSAHTFERQQEGLLIREGADEEPGEEFEEITAAPAGGTRTRR